MESTNTQSPDSPTDAAPSPLGELVVQTGRPEGARCALAAPLTLIGRAADCDVRLNVEGVDIHHCALVQGPAGLVLRDLQSGGGTYVNGQAVATCILHEGDRLAVGPFQFQVRLPAEAPETEAVRRQKEALRIQAAAVAAQQAALTEEEIRLGQRCQALEQQEQQLAAHLEEKRQRLLMLREEARLAHDALRDERAAYEKRVADVLHGLERSRREVAQSFHQNQAERQRLLGLRGRLKRRWHRQWAGERMAMRRREAEVVAERRALEKERERLQQERASALQVHLRARGEVEVSRRQLQDEGDRLGRERGELQERGHRLEEQAAALAGAEQVLAEDRRHWQERRLLLEKELEGLESRVRNHRRIILDQNQEAVRLEALVRGLQEGPALGAEALAVSQPPSVAAVAPAAFEQREWQLRKAEANLQTQTAALETLAGELMDQRLQMTEECERLAQAQQRWQQDRAAVAAELETLGVRFQEREQALRSRELSYEASERGLRQRLDEVERAQRHLEAWKSRLAAGAAMWEGERERLLAELRVREEGVEQRLAALHQLRERWQKRRRQQVSRLQVRRTACEETRRQCAALQAEWDRREAALVQEQRALAERALALEQYRQECIGKAANAAAAEKRLEGLRRHWASLSTAAQRALAGARQQLEANAGRLEERVRQLHQQEAELCSQEADLSGRQAAWEQQQVVAEGEQAKSRQEVHSLRSQRQHFEQQLQDLRDEVERLARLLLEESDPPSVPATQAA